jgi:hypothetical protein
LVSVSDGIDGSALFSKDGIRDLRLRLIFAKMTG